MRATVRGTCPVCRMLVSARPGGIIYRHSGVVRAQGNGWPSCSGTGQRVVQGFVEQPVADRGVKQENAASDQPLDRGSRRIREAMLAMLKPVRRR